MTHIVCAIYDNKTQSYHAPFYVKHTAQAERWFATVLMDANSDIAKFPADYSLVQLGEFDEETGKHTEYQTGQKTLLQGLQVAAQIKNAKDAQ